MLFNCVLIENEDIVQRFFNKSNLNKSQLIEDRFQGTGNLNEFNEENIEVSDIEKKDQKVRYNFFNRINNNEQDMAQNIFIKEIYSCSYQEDKLDFKNKLMFKTDLSIYQNNLIKIINQLSDFISNSI